MDKENGYPENPFEMSYADMVKHAGYKKGESNGDEIYRVRNQDYVINDGEVLDIAPPIVNILTDEEVGRMNIVEGLTGVDKKTNKSTERIGPDHKDSEEVFHVI